MLLDEAARTERELKAQREAEAAREAAEAAAARVDADRRRRDADQVLQEGLELLKACPTWDTLHGQRCWMLGRRTGMANTDAGETVPRYLDVLTETGRIKTLDLDWSWYDEPESPAILDRFDPSPWDKQDGPVHAPLGNMSSLQKSIAAAVVRYRR